MIIPKRFTVNGAKWTVEQVQSITGPVCHGRTYFSTSHIRIAYTNGRGKFYTPRQRAEAFWHETIHVALEDMGIPLHKHDEKFIDALANRLTQVVNSAEI